MGSRASNNLWSGLFRISVDSGQTLQAQIRQALVTAILDRQVPANQPLPSCRALASGLNVARGTVVLAYQQLVDQGFLIAEERRGHFINPEALTEMPARDRAEDKDAENAVCWSTRLLHRPTGSRQIEKPADWISYRYPFVYGQFDPTLFPTASWRECSHMALGVREIRNWASDMQDRDDPLLVEQIQARILPKRGIFARPEEIMVTLGAQNALYLLGQLLIGPDTMVAIEDPGYPDARNIFSARSGNLRFVPVDANGLDPEILPVGCDYVFTTPSHQCPTAARLPLARREALLERAVRDDFVVIEDDYDSQIAGPEPPLPALKSLDRAGRVVYVGSLSKTLAPGLRLGYLVADAAIIEELRVLRRLMFRHPPANNQRAVALFLSLGHHDALVHRLAQAYASRGAIFKDAMDRIVPELALVSPGEGNAFWVSGPPDIAVDRLAEHARGRGVLVEPGSVFFACRDNGANMMRMGISSIADRDIEPGVRELSRALVELRRSGGAKRTRDNRVAAV